MAICANTAGIDMTQEALKLALDALIWTTGSGDFGEGGYAHEGAKKCLFPAIAAIQEALAQTQEPVAWMDADGNVSDNNDHKCFPIPLYTTPPQRTEQKDKHDYSQAT